MFRPIGKAQTKEEVLAHYADHKEPVHFLQYDGFVCRGWDYVLRPDDEGDGLTGSQTWELMSGFPEVRVLLPDKTTPVQAARLLHKIATSLEIGGNWAADDRDFLEAALPHKEQGGDLSEEDLPF